MHSKIFPLNHFLLYGIYQKGLEIQYKSLTVNNRKRRKNRNVLPQAREDLNKKTDKWKGNIVQFLYWMEKWKNHTYFGKSLYGKGTGLVSPINTYLFHISHCRVTDTWFALSTHFISSCFFSLWTSAFCPCRTQVCRLMCNPIKQASIIASYGGWQSMPTQPTRYWVLAARWVHTSYRFKREDTKHGCNLLFYSKRPFWREEGALGIWPGCPKED